MTLQEARKVVGLNIHKLNGSMQMAVATIMEEAEKIQALKAVLENRSNLLRKAIETSKKNKTHLTTKWLDGKECGYFDVLGLLNSKPESILIEL